MKTKNQTEHSMLELASKKAANEDDFSATGAGEVAVQGRNQSWSPYEVWRTRVKSATHAVKETVQA